MRLLLLKLMAAHTKWRSVFVNKRKVYRDDSHFVAIFVLFPEGVNCILDVAGYVIGTSLFYILQLPLV